MNNNENNISVNLNNLSDEERQTLISLIEKANKPKSKVWKPEKNETFFFIDWNCGTQYLQWSDDCEDKLMYSIGNCFPTEEAAKFEVEKLKVMTELKRYALEHNEEDIDWNNPDQNKFSIIFNYDRLCVFIKYNNIFKHNDIYFSSEEIAQAAIKEIGENRIKKYLCDVDVDIKKEDN